jgi:2-polyprenyl-3-methyl-5-hydroxy-6-metoxy-1,4-benzoquinol methylase
MLVSCAICQGKMAYFQSKDKYLHYLCQNCKTISVHPLPENLLELYSDEANYAGTGPISTGSFKIQRKLRGFLASILCNFATSPNVLDIGCSTGSFLSFVKGMGFVTTGVEPSQKLASHAKAIGHEVLNHDFHASLFPDAKFDLITCFDVIEHVVDPREFLLNVVQLMSPTSYLLIKTPNMNSLWANLTFWLSKNLNLPSSVLTPPHHVHNFTNQSLDYLANSEGLELMFDWDSRENFLYELGQLHLLKEFKTKMNFFSFRRLIIGFISYGLMSIFSMSATYFARGFNMTRVYKLNDRRSA